MTSPSPEMREKALRFMQGKADHTSVLMADFAEAAVREAVSDAIKIIEHFGFDTLTKDEWPPHGLARALDRADSGRIETTCKNVASALRQKYQVGE